MPSTRPTPHPPPQPTLHVFFFSETALDKKSRDLLYSQYYMSHVMRKPVFGVCDQVRLKPACAAIKQWITKVLIRLRGCAGWFAPLLFAHGINRIFHLFPLRQWQIHRRGRKAQIFHTHSLYKLFRFLKLRSKNYWIFFAKSNQT